MSSVSSTSSLRFFQYARKSSDRDDRQVTSLPDQVAVLAQIQRRDHIRIVDAFEESRSAKKLGNRPLFTQMLARIERGEADAILCWHVNRLVRNRQEAGHLEQLLIDGKIRCIKTPEREYWSADNALYLAFDTAQAAQYSRDLSTDVGRGIREKAERGVWPCRPKLGYAVDPDTKDVVAQPTDFAYLRRGWELMLTECNTVPEVLAELTALGFRVKANRPREEHNRPRELKPLSRSSLYRIFKDPFYAGLFRYNGTLRPGKHPAMVSAGEFDRVQRFLARGEKAQPQKHEYAYTGLVRCGVCGSMVTAERKVKRYAATGRERVYTYYHCSGSRGCRKLSIAEEDIDTYLGELLQSCHLDPEMLAWASKELESDKQASLVEPIDELDSRQKGELAQAQRRLDTLFDMRELGEITSEEFMQRKQSLAVVIDELTLAIQTRSRRRASVVSILQEKLDALPTAFREFLEGEPRARKRFARLVSDRYLLTLEREVPYLKVDVDPLFDLVRTFSLKSHPPQQMASGGSGSCDPVWRTFRDELRSLVERRTAASVGEMAEP